MKLPLCWVVLWLRDGTVVRVAAEHESAIEQAVERHVGDGADGFIDIDERDTLLKITDPSGMRMRVRASAINGWHVSTPGHRRSHGALDRLITNEARQAGPAGPPTSGAPQ